jgi:hypothetical protein
MIYNISVQIIIEDAPARRYKGSLIIEDEVVQTTIQSRPGCCVRNLLNYAMLQYGKPTEKLVLDINGW